MGLPIRPVTVLVKDTAVVGLESIGLAGGVGSTGGSLAPVGATSLWVDLVVAADTSLGGEVGAAESDSDEHSVSSGRVGVTVIVVVVVELDLMVVVASEAVEVVVSGETTAEGLVGMAVMSMLAEEVVLEEASVGATTLLPLVVLETDFEADG